MAGIQKRGKGRAMTDLQGQRFGRLVVQYPMKKRDKRGSVYWHCVCDCGKETEATENSLVYGNKRSCGCLKTECLPGMAGKAQEQKGQHQRLPWDLLPEKRPLPGGHRI